MNHYREVLFIDAYPKTSNITISDRLVEDEHRIVEHI